MLTRQIPSSGEHLPVIGLGTWQVLDVADPNASPALTEVLSAFHAGGGRLIDSSPMYGNSERSVGVLTQQSGHADDFFYATKVWTTGKNEGIRQLENSFRLMQRSTIDLVQIHNLVDWQTQLKTLQEWKEAGRIRYIGITHYLSDMHDELAKMIRTVPLDFVQFNYSITDRDAEQRLLPVAAEHGVATIINRPLDVGKIFSKVRNTTLPGWCAEYGITTWSQFMLKYIISHPAVTSVIPATANPVHMKDNVAAGHSIITDQKVLTRMVEFITSL